jgi:hypothetical protein
MKRAFTPISIADYIQKQMDRNGSMTKREIKDGLMRALEAYHAGTTCECGDPIWVIGSAWVGNKCFACITGETPTSDDYEIDEACE